MAPGDEDEILEPGGTPTEYEGPFEAGLKDANARAVRATGGCQQQQSRIEKGRR